MSYYVVQVVCAARGNDSLDWMQILLFIFIIVASMVIKAVRAKKGIPDKDKKIPQRPGPSHPVPHRQSQQGIQPVPRRVTPGHPVVQKTASKAGKPVLRHPAGKPVISSISAPIGELDTDIQEAPELETKIQELPEFTGETINSLKEKKISNSVPSELDEILFDYSEPDELRRAILHYEILGKPVSMRRPE